MITRGNGLRMALAVVFGAVLASGCASTMELGKGGSMVTGSAGEGGTQGEAKQLVKCPAPVATVALAEDQGSSGVLVRYGLPKSPLPLLRLMLAQTGCFKIVDRSAGLRATERELELVQRGMVKPGGGVAKGQITAARYTLTPHIVFSESNAGGAGIGALLGAFVPKAAILGGVVGNLRFKEAQTVIFLTDNATTEQVGAAEGSATATDMGVGGGVLGVVSGGLGGGGASAWSNTNEGKVVAAALLDAVNKLVPSIRALKQ